jgi:hypothetical protein
MGKYEGLGEGRRVRVEGQGRERERTRVFRLKENNAKGSGERLLATTLSGKPPA